MNTAQNFGKLLRGTIEVIHTEAGKRYYWRVYRYGEEIACGMCMLRFQAERAINEEKNKIRKTK